MDAPTTRSDWSTIAAAIRRTLATPGLLPLAVLVAVATATAASIARRLPFVADVLGSSGLSIGFKLEFLLLHLPLVGGDPGRPSAIAGVLVATVAGITAAVLVGDALRSERRSGDSDRRDAALVVGVLAIVVAACGPGLLAGVAGLTGADPPTAWPLGGLEVSVLAVPAMLLAIYWIADEAVAPTGA